MRTIIREHLKQMLDRNDDLLVVNVLDHDQYEKAHIPGSVNVPLEEGFIERISDLAGSRDKRIVTYCANYKCTASTMAAQRLEAEGFKAVFDYKGGMQDWMDAGFPVDGQMRAAA